VEPQGIRVSYSSDLITKFINHLLESRVI